MEPVNCAGCGKVAYPSEKPLLALKKTWHPQCLKCTVCGTTLNMKSLESADNKPYCRPHKPLLKPTQVKANESIAVNTALNAPKKKAEGLSTAHKGASELAPKSSGDFGVNVVGDQSTESKPVASAYSSSQQSSQPAAAPRPIAKPAVSSAPPPARPAPSSAPSRPPAPAAAISAPPKAAPPPPKAAPPPPAPDPVQQEETPQQDDQGWGEEQQQQQQQQEQTYDEQPQEQTYEEQPQEEQQQWDQTQEGSGGRIVTALYDYAGENEGDLPFKEGDQITVIDDSDPSGWWTGALQDGTQGTFPSNFVQ